MSRSANWGWGLAATMILGQVGILSEPARAAEKTASFEVTAEHTGGSSSVTIRSKVWATQTQARAEIKHPLEGDSTVLVTGGKVYQFAPKEKQGVWVPAPKQLSTAKNADNFEFLVAMFAFDARNVMNQLKKVRSEKVSGYDCDVYSSTLTKGEAKRSLTIWMPQTLQPKFPLKAEKVDTLEKPGATVKEAVTITLTNLKLNQPIPATTFAVPTGIKMIDGQKAGQPPAGAGKPPAKPRKR